MKITPKYFYDSLIFHSEEEYRLFFEPLSRAEVAEMLDDVDLKYIPEFIEDLRELNAQHVNAFSEEKKYILSAKEEEELFQHQSWGGYEAECAFLEGKPYEVVKHQNQEPRWFAYAILRLEEKLRANKEQLSACHSKSLIKQKASTNDVHSEGAIPVELRSSIAGEIFEQAREMGLMSDNYVWLKGMQLLACFAREMSLKLGLGKGHNSDGTPRVSWRPFEVLFKLPHGKLRTNYNDILKTGQQPSEAELIDRLFKEI